MSSIGTPRRDPVARSRPRSRRPPRRHLGPFVALVGLAAAVSAVIVAIRAHHTVPGVTVPLSNGRTLVLPATPGLSPLRARIVRLAESQIGYRTDPATSYCNKFSAHFQSGSTNCPPGEEAEEWCADFAAWTWQQAGALVTYQYLNGDLNSSAASFYEWGRAHGTWHPRSSGYRPLPGDVAVYGLNPTTLVAAHVAVVIGQLPHEAGPVAVNGDGDLTGFSVVEVRTNELYADIHPTGAPLAGYVAPTPAT